MSGVTRILIERLRSGVVSRNRNFRLFVSPEACEALRVHRYLRSIEHDVLAHGSKGDLRALVHDDGADRVTLHLEFPSLGASRTCGLSRAEFALLLQDPRIPALIGQG